MEMDVIKLPEPEVQSCYFDDAFVPSLSTMCLRWPDEARGGRWSFPASVCLTGPPPERFGVRIHRTDDDAYEIYLRWNNISLHWQATPRDQLVRSAIGTILAALGTNVDHILDQPISGEAGCWLSHAA